MHRILSLALLICLSLSAQDDFGRIDPAIIAYLKLTPEQIDAIVTLRGANFYEATQRSRAIGMLRVSLALETIKTVPDPAVLGRHHAGITILNRQSDAARIALGADERKLLTMEQTALLTPLREAQRLSPFINQMECEGFLDMTPPRTQFCFTSSSAAASSASAKSEINSLPQISPSSPVTQYLELNVEQIASITVIQQDFSRWRNGKAARQEQVTMELAAEDAKPDLDELAIGLRLLELETIRRELEQEFRNVATAIQAKLNPVQISKLKAIEDARQFGSLDSTMQSEGFLFPLCATLRPIPATCSIPVTATGHNN